ncbi:hypothetical protein HYW46_03460 [Candidatus Daviesbacteria bacterium]|nr:hypothetical protein [Candidatus Daviesbacteria bacterium]
MKETEILVLEKGSSWEKMDNESLHLWIDALNLTIEHIEKILEGRERKTKPNPVFADRRYFFHCDD